MATNRGAYRDCADLGCSDVERVDGPIETAQPGPGTARVLGVDVDVLDQIGATARVIALRRQAPALVVTANLDHAVRLRADATLKEIYSKADLVLADGFPLVLASHLRGPRLPERVTGADLIEPLCAEASRVGMSIFVLGTTLSILSRACRRLLRAFPGLIVAGTYSPSFGFTVGHPECEEAIRAIREAGPDIVFVALGSPKQERWVSAYMHQLPPAVYVCTGAGFDYLADQPQRAPRVVRRLCLEWLWRWVHEPRRLAKRYVLDILSFPILLAEHLGWSRPVPILFEVQRAAGRSRPSPGSALVDSFDSTTRQAAAPKPSSSHSPLDRRRWGA